MTRLAVRTACKVNLFLRILGRRPDGYHELRTRFQTIDLGDELEAERSGDLTLEVDDPAIPADGTNLVLRAAELLRREAGRRDGARIVLRKRVPAGGGLGGGSADAAAALLLLRELWQLPIADGRLAELGAGLGSDVPFFLTGGTALGTGRGERIEPEPDQPPRDLLLLVPPGSLSTPLVYQTYAELRAGSRPSASLTAPAPVPRILPSDEVVERGNDLEAAAFALRPDLAGLRERLLETGADEAWLCGSGVCLFALHGAGIPEAALGGWPPGVRAVPGRFLSRTEYRSRLLPRRT